MKVVIIHGWDGLPKHGWYPWLKDELDKRNIITEIPEMNFKKSSHSEIMAKIAMAVGKPDEKIILVGHSAGCIAILNYLDKLTGNEKILGAVFVSGFSENIYYEKIDNFFEKPVNWKSAKNHCKFFVAINSDNDPYVKLDNGEIFKEKLGAELIIEHNKGHIDQKAGIYELPSALNAVVKISQQQ